ncbi:hypothetical protein FA95DRAFT_967732 [Auriscalpium vulgare]|uniref:Uncharacterized protein n=1 Tax=Auriscalpium vulgare TaxID=40419 RepID=A0ACB8R7B1_9AGAM|nr:hypothetical protein FA95DRAFT_967732 [Auriscalpium vulgare]
MDARVTDDSVSVMSASREYSVCAASGREGWERSFLFVACCAAANKVLPSIPSHHTARAPHTNRSPTQGRPSAIAALHKSIVPSALLTALSAGHRRPRLMQPLVRCVCATAPVRGPARGATDGRLGSIDSAKRRRRSRGDPSAPGIHHDATHNSLRLTPSPRPPTHPPAAQTLRCPVRVHLRCDAILPTPLAVTPSRIQKQHEFGFAEDAEEGGAAPCHVGGARPAEGRK